MTIIVVRAIAIGLVVAGIGGAGLITGIPLALVAVGAGLLVGLS